MHEVFEIDGFLPALVFSLVLIFGILALLTGLLMAVFGSEKSRAMGFLQMAFGWTALFALYLFLWNRDFFVQMIGVIIGGIVGAAIAFGLLLFLVMKS